MAFTKMGMKMKFTGWMQRLKDKIQFSVKDNFLKDETMTNILIYKQL